METTVESDVERPVEMGVEISVEISVETSVENGPRRALRACIHARTRTREGFEPSVYTRVTWNAVSGLDLAVILSLCIQSGGRLYAAWRSVCVHPRSLYPGENAQVV